MIRCSALSGRGQRRCNAGARVPCVVRTPVHCVGVGGAGLVACTPEGAGCACMTDLDLVPVGPAVALFVPGGFNCAPVGQSQAHCCWCWGRWSGGWYHCHQWSGPPHRGLAGVGLCLAGGKHVHHCCLHVLEGLGKLCVGCNEVVDHHVFLD
jgi:hypothetical protein